MHLSIASPTPPTWGQWWGFVKPDLYTILHIWGIVFLANPLQYPTHHPGDLLLLIETLYVAVCW